MRRVVAIDSFKGSSVGGSYRKLSSLSKMNLLAFKM